MAKWGEGDPRWIVEERPDATNVNNWHWTEKNACAWSKDRFNDLFVNYNIENELFVCKITEVRTCNGEAAINNRKGKLIFFYEWDITLNWQAKLKGTENYVKGKIGIPNLSEENEIHEVDVNITTDESTPEGSVLQETMREYTIEKVREQLSKYVQSLKAEFSQGMILPSKGSSEDTECKGSINNVSTKSKVQVNSDDGTVKGTPDADGPGQKLRTTTLNISDVFQCTERELYDALTLSELVAAFTHGPVSIDLKKGGKFDLLGGNITGEFVELVPYSKIVQTWRCKRWPSGHHSLVTFEIVQQSDFTEFKLTQIGIPQDEAESIRGNWDKYYLNAIKSTFGFGYFC